MNVLIVEDETAAYETLEALLKEIDSTIKIVGVTESIDQTIHWLTNNPEPDLIFLDIQLSDGISFLIFERLTIEIPIIFTTAYNEFAIQAFKQNSIDYLLKPIKQEELENALHKYKRNTQNTVFKYLSRLSRLAPNSNYINKLLLPYKDQLVPVKISDISYFYNTNKNTQVTLKNGRTYPISKTLEQIYLKLNPKDFYRANKQYIISRSSIENITIWFDNRLYITLDVEVPERMYISKNKAAEFKEWLVKD